MDRIDRQIIAILQREGRSSYARIGGAVGLSISAVNERVKRLESQGVIAGYGARVNPEAVGLGVLAFISVAIDWRNRDTAFLEGVAAMPEVLEVHQVTGDWTYLIKVRVPDHDGLEDILSKRIKLLPGVTRSETVFVLRSAKETAELPVGAG
jgi:Lrp/AsnC family transcriptional regulator, leucine-responsive regulatory protein